MPDLLSRRRPESVRELAAIVLEAKASGQGIYPIGGGTMFDVGRAPTKPGFLIDTTALNTIDDYPARDMTITVQPGVTIQALQDALAVENQWLPIDVPNPDLATVGGVIAANVSGSHRYGYGTIRDYLIGIQFLTDDGIEVKGGGRVVKNVAGYDLMKLQVGALGTLGVITQATFKVKPKSESVAIIRCGVTLDRIGTLLELLHASKSRPVAIELLNPPSAEAIGLSNAQWQCVIGFEEKATTVKWQRTTLLDELKAANISVIAEETAKIWPTIAGLQIHPASRYIGKANVLPSRVAAEIAKLPHADSCIIHAQPLNGILWLHSTETPDWPATVAVRRASNVWGNATQDPAWKLMEHIKRTIDPNDLFSPGRLFD